MEYLEGQWNEAAAQIEIEELRKQLSSQKITLAIRDSALKKASVGDDDLKARKDALNKELAEIREAERIRDAEKTQIRKAREELAKQAAELERNLQRMLRNQADNLEFEKMISQFDFDTKDKPWRSHAMNHQIEGAKRLASARSAILGDKRGLGKTMTSLIWLDMLNAKKVIVFVPKDVASNFEREVKRWAPDRPVINMVRIKKGVRNAHLEMIPEYSKCFVIINYDAWVRDWSLVDALKDCQFDSVIIDEAHNIKNHKTNAFEGISEIVFANNKCPLCSGDSFVAVEKGMGRTLTCANAECGMERVDDSTFRSIKNTLAMSGTTILNKPQDIWPLLNLTDHKNFRTLRSFLDDFAYQDKDTKRWMFNYGGQKQLVRKLGTRYVGRDEHSAGVKFPKQDHVVHELSFEGTSYKAQMQIIREIHDGEIWMNDEQSLPIASLLSHLLRLRQAMTWPDGIVLKNKDGEVVLTSNVRESIKMDKAEELAESIVNDEEDRVIVYSMFKAPLYELQRRLEAKGIDAVVYDGSTTMKKRDEIQRDFDIKSADKHSRQVPCTEVCAENNCQGGFKYQVFIGQYESSSTGINLTGARQMILMDRYWSPGREDQAEGRIQRLDSVESSIVHRLDVKPTSKFDKIDQWMNGLIDMKARNIDGFQDAVNTDYLKNMLFGNE